MKKKYQVFFIFLAFLFTIGLFGGKSIRTNAFADEVVSIEIKSKAVYMKDFNSGTLIYCNNENERLPIASMCKIMTLLLCFENIDNGNIDLNEDIIISDDAAGMGGSQVFLECNASYKVHELIKSITVASANDASVAMAERICGSEDAFVSEMNLKAKELSMNNTCFTNCTGLPKPGQYSTAKDVSIMFGELLKHNDYFKFSSIWMDEISHPKCRKTEISNTNKLIRFYDGCDSGKTGYTSEAGHCLAASAVRDNMRLVCVVISAPDGKTRFKEVSSLFNYGFANYVNKLVVDGNSPLDIPVNVVCGKKDFLSVKAERSLYLFSSRKDKRSVEIDFKPCDKVKAPITKGDIVGEICIYEKGKLLESVKIIANEDIEAKTYFDYIHDIINNWSICA